MTEYTFRGTLLSANAKTSNGSVRLRVINSMYDTLYIVKLLSICQGFAHIMISIGGVYSTSTNYIVDIDMFRKHFKRVCVVKLL